MSHATTRSYTLSLHDALPIWDAGGAEDADCRDGGIGQRQAERAAGERQQQAFDQHLPHQSAPSGAERGADADFLLTHRSEEHTSELQSPCNLVCRLLLEKKNI